MSEDKTFTRIALYMTTIWLVLGELGVFYHFHQRSVMMLVVGGLVGAVTAGGVVAIVWSKKLVLKLVAEPLTMFGVVSSAIGFFFHPFAWLTIPVGLIVLFAFFAMLYDEKEESERKAKFAKESAALKAAKAEGVSPAGPTS